MKNEPSQHQQGDSGAHKADPGTVNPGTANPGTGNPGTGNSGSGHSARANSTSGAERGRWRSSGGGTRFWIGSQVLLSAALALAAVLLINYLVARPGIRLRFDTTAKNVNSLDPSTERVLENLPDDVTVDLFFRAVNPPLGDLVRQVQMRTLGLLQIMEAESAERLRVRKNDMTDVALIQQRMRDLKLRGLENAAVVSSGDQVEVVRLVGGLATFALGNPNPDNYRPPAIRSFDAEINLQKAILSVTRGQRPKIHFLAGHGEADPFENGQETAGLLETTLREDGFVTHTWNPIEDGDLPEDAFVLAIIGPTDAIAEATQNRIERFVRAGGRLLIAPHPDARAMQTSGLDLFVQRFGLEITEGTVLEPHPDPAGTGALVTSERSALFPIHPNHMKRHEIMEPFIAAGRSFVAPYTHAVRVVKQPKGTAGLSMPLFSSNPRVSWLDSYPLNFRHDAEIEVLQAYDLAAVSEFTSEDGAVGEDGTERTRSRIALLGSAGFLYNATLESRGGGGSSLDLARNVCNWLADREWRVNVAPKDPDLRLLDREQIPWVSRLAFGGLPALFLVAGLLVAWRRSRGGVVRRAA